MFAREKAPRGMSLACLLLCFLHATAAQTPEVLPSRRYTLVRFADVPGGAAAEYTVRVPENARASLRLTDLGCPGERYAVAEGTSVLFQTRRVPANASCDDPLGLAQSAQAYSDRRYSSGQASLPPGDHAIRVTPLGPVSGDAAIGVFIRRINSTVAAPPTETTQSVSTTAAEGEEDVVTVTATGYATLLTTLTLPVTTDDGNTVTTTVADATSTVVSAVESEVVVTETPTLSYTVVTVVSTVVSEETLTSETVVEGTTITVTEVVTFTEEVESLTTVTLPAVTATREETTTVLATSTALVTETVSPEGTTHFVTTYVTAGSEECTVPVVTSVVALTSTDTVVIFTTAAPESTATVTETSTVETATETVSFAADHEEDDDQGGTGSAPAAGPAAATPEPGPARPAKRARAPLPRAAAGDPIASSAPVVVTVVAAAPTATVTVSEICLPSATLTITAPPTAAPSAEPPAPPRVCGRRKGGLALVTDRLAFPRAREACRALGGDLAEIRRFNFASDAIDLLRLCNATRAWIEPTSVNTITKPQCFVLARNYWYEPADCLTGARPVLCADAADQQARPAATTEL